MPMPSERRKRGQQVLVQQRERPRITVELRPDPVAEVVQRLVAAEQHTRSSGGEAVVVEAVAAVGDALPAFPADLASAVRRSAAR